MNKCEKCGTRPVGEYGLHDYCAVCSRNLCDELEKTAALAVAEKTAALAVARGSWAIVRKGERDKSPTVRKFTATKHNDAESWAKLAWKALDVREGWALLVNPDGAVIARQSGPWGRTWPRAMVAWLLYRLTMPCLLITSRVSDRNRSTFCDPSRRRPGARAVPS